jgi:transcriptional regulator with XRE-family HTH domain
MPNRHRRRRAGRHRINGRRRADELARRVGNSIRDRRAAMGASQTEVGEAAGLSQTWVSLAERGGGRAGSLETWASLAEAVGGRLVVYVEDSPSADRPRDHEHLIRQDLVIRVATPGGWTGTPEHGLRPDGVERWRYVDLLLRRTSTRELAVVEVWNLLADVGDGLRGLATKVERLHTLNPGWSVTGLLVVRATARNRRTVARLSALFQAALSASSAACLRALQDPGARLPSGNGMLWSDVAGTRLFAARRREVQHVKE